MSSIKKDEMRPIAAERIAVAVSATPPDKQSILLAIFEAVIIGAQIADQCAAPVKKDAS